MPTNQIGGEAGYGYVQDYPVVVQWPTGGGATSTGSASVGGGSAGRISAFGITNIYVPGAPVARFSYTAYYGGVVQFTNLTQNAASLYLWDFGDGTTSTLSDPIHTYLLPGVYVVKLTAQGSAISTYSLSINVTIVAKQADFTSVIGGYRAYFTFSGNFAPSNYLWDFGDGTTSTEAAPVHEYAANGTYSVTLIADGLSASHDVTIDTEILLSWQDNSGDELGFKVYHSLDGLTGWTLLTTLGAGITSYGVTEAVDGVDASVINYFKVTAYKADAESDPTNIVAVQCSGG